MKEEYCVFCNRLVHADRKQLSVYEWLNAGGMDSNPPGHWVYHQWR